MEFKHWLLVADFLDQAIVIAFLSCWPNCVLQLHVNIFGRGAYHVSRLVIYWLRESYDKETKEFSGNLANTKNYRSRCTKFPWKRKNGENWWLQRCTCFWTQRRPFCSTSWSMLFEDEATKLKNNIKAKDAALRGSLTVFDSVCQESSTAVPLLTVAENHVRKSLLLPASLMPHRFSAGYHSP